MILYFSGTGNSLYIAKKMAEELNDYIISIADLVCKQRYELTVAQDETIGFVYPVIACAPPDIVTDFIKKLCCSTRCFGFTGRFTSFAYDNR